jgi:hypothetical protein
MPDTKEELIRFAAKLSAQIKKLPSGSPKRTVLEQEYKKIETQIRNQRAEL